MSDAERQTWDQRYRELGATTREPATWIVAQKEYLPAHGRALDVAGGTGRHAVWLAQQGLDVTLADISTEGLTLAGQVAETARVTVRTLQTDLAETGLPMGPWDLILCSHYLDRDVYRQFAPALAPGGTLLFIHPTIRNLERHDRPGRRFLLAENELLTLVTGLTICRYDEGWSDEDRHEAKLVARRIMT
ncbi:MAG: class I SAM-dependent methyltransferase [Candidatus Sericytochromatia bacterium]|nr:class I SAM-dependent methyltransferase [Candidatus Sericytochromatia bacterium]